MTGSVRRAGTRIRVTAQLINAEDGYHLWSQRYDRELTDVFAVQSVQSLGSSSYLSGHTTLLPAPLTGLLGSVADQLAADGAELRAQRDRK